LRCPYRTACESRYAAYHGDSAFRPSGKPESRHQPRTYRATLGRRRSTRPWNGWPGSLIPIPLDGVAQLFDQRLTIAGILRFQLVVQTLRPLESSGNAVVEEDADSLIHDRRSRHRD